MCGYESVGVLTLSPVMRRLPIGFHRIIVMPVSWSELFENVHTGLDLPLASQHDTRPSAQPMANTFPLGCHSRVVASLSCVIELFGRAFP